MKQYRLTDDQLKRVKDASKPTPAMYLSGGQPMFNSPQENANAVWQSLGKEMGFKWNTGRPAPTGDEHDFLAEPLSPPEAGSGDSVRDQDGQASLT